MTPSTPEGCGLAEGSCSLLSQRSASEVTPSWLTATLDGQTSTYTSGLLAHFHLSSPFTFILRLVYALLNAGETEAMAALLKSSDLLPYLRFEKPRSYSSPAQHRKRIVLKLWNAHLSDLPADFAYRVRHALRRSSRKSGVQAPLLLTLAAREGCIVVVLEVGELGSSATTAAGAGSQPDSSNQQGPVSVAFAQALVKQVMKELQRTGVRPADGHTAYIQVGDLMCVAVYQSSTGEWQATSSPIADWAPAVEQGACVVTVTPPIARVVRPISPLAGDSEGVALLLTVQLQHSVRQGSPAYRVYGWTAPVPPSGGAPGQQQPVIQRPTTLPLLSDSTTASTPVASAAPGAGGRAEAQLQGEQAQSLSLLVRSAREYMPTRVVSQEVVSAGPASPGSQTLQAPQAQAATASPGQLCVISVQLEVTLLPSIFREAVAAAAAAALRQQVPRHAPSRSAAAAGQQPQQAPPSPPPLRDLTIELWQGHVLLDVRNTLIYLSKPRSAMGTAGPSTQVVGPLPSAQSEAGASAVQASQQLGQSLGPASARSKGTAAASALAPATSLAVSSVPNLAASSQQLASSLQQLGQAGSGGLAAAGPSPRRPVLPRDLLDGRVSLTGEPGMLAPPWSLATNSAASSRRSTGIPVAPVPATSSSQLQVGDIGTSTAAGPVNNSAPITPAVLPPAVPAATAAPATTGAPPDQQRLGNSGRGHAGHAVGTEASSSGSDLFEEMMRAAEAEEQERQRRPPYYTGLQELQEAAQGLQAHPPEFMQQATPLGPGTSLSPVTPTPAGNEMESAAGASGTMRSASVATPGALAALAQAARDVVASPQSMTAGAARVPLPHSSFIADVGSFYALIAHLQMHPQSNSDSSDNSNSTSSETTMRNHINLAWALGRALLRHAVLNGLATIAVSLMSTMAQLSALDAFATPGASHIRTYANTSEGVNNSSSAEGGSGPDTGSLQGSNSSHQGPHPRQRVGSTTAEAVARSAPRFPVTLEQFGVGEGTIASSSDTSAPTSSSAIALPRSTNPPSLTSSIVVSAADRGLSQEGQNSRSGSTGGAPIPHVASSGSMSSARRHTTDSAHHSASASQASRSSAAESHGHRSNLSGGSAESAAARTTPARPPCALCDHALLQLLQAAQAAQEPALMMRLLVWGKTATCPMLHSYESIPTEPVELPDWATGVNPSQLQAEVLERLNMVNSQQLLSLMRGSRQPTVTPPRQSGEEQRQQGSADERQQQEQDRFMPAADLPEGQQALEPIPAAAVSAHAAGSRPADHQSGVSRLRGGSSPEPHIPQAGGEAVGTSRLASPGNTTALVSQEVRHTDIAHQTGPSGVLGFLVYALLADGDTQQSPWTPARLLRIFAWFLFDVINAALVYTQAISWLANIYDPEGSSPAGSYFSGSMLRVLAITLLFVVHYVRLVASQRLRGRLHQ